ncbi:related to Ribosome-recycling factor, mitochondrial [Saccharomycodes ludwigii]|uniref:Ribosome-recycling factor, mitochondrial n=1 Tax=Saccharomycodes ludwigii TaxID=36035 RepID=A0A376B2X0_9ASCO|nr:hypothetical protein SCDLUD_004602 [Saccharomycodes ludwigii]KAH3899173.1 hypothetical protein SCDLUD_004602 [Saccharomycodes ludwigii]SSD58962.1 related to Ribosome-recycling factor, mitochondrial [Saccharomycodes ludwigii]
MMLFTHAKRALITNFIRIKRADKNIYRNVFLLKQLGTSNSLFFFGQKNNLFSTVSYRFAKKPKSSKNKKKTDEQQPADAEETVTLNIKDYQKNVACEMNEILELHKKKINESKMGLSNPKIFDKLMVGSSKFVDVATTTTKGRNMFIVTVFDPSNTKNVISAILGSGMNLNPERLPDNEQQLKISLPPVTSESRNKLAKELKRIFEDFKNTNKSGSLSSVRSKYMKDLKEFDQKNQDVKKCIQEVEKIHKDFVSKLHEQFKQAEKNIMK